MARIITNKYEGECKKCGKLLEVGSQVQYVKWAGIFCSDHELTTEDIREARQERADRRANRLINKADRLNRLADDKQAGFNKFRGDIAFATQPGHIPFRRRLIDRYDKGMELRNEADQALERAESIRNSVRVKGDAERRRQEIRAYITQKVKVGDKVNWMYSKELEVVRINKKTFTLKGDFGNFTADKSFCSLIKKEA